MKEADIVAKIKTELLKQLPGAVILKLNDISTKGIPDLAVNWARRVTYVEVKLLRPKESESTFRKHFDKLQLATCQLLDNQIRCWYFIGLPGGREATLVRPYVLKNILDHDDIGVENFKTLASEAAGGINLVIDQLAHLCRRNYETL
jgi:hypothetical protein